MTQNATYIDQYVDLIKQGYFTQSPDLHKINDINMWEKYRKTPTLDYVADRDYYSMELSDNPIYKEVFKSYQSRDKGYWPDLVWDGFFNGYTPNGKEELYMPARDGGFFYPLLGKESIAKKINMGSYEFFSETVLNNLRAGNAVALSYISAGPAHAITIWGAEVDEKGNLKRLYFTDSDDFDGSDKTEEGILKGLYSNEVVKDSRGNARLTTRDDRTKGSKVDSVFILSLAQDKLKKGLNDLNGPVIPNITEDLPNLGYKNAFETPRSLEVKVKKEDSGTLSYQWYEANDMTSLGKKIEGAINSTYTPTPIKGQDKYYYCVVNNTKHGQTAKAITNRSRVFVDENVINAIKPDVYYTLNGGSREFIYNQYDQPNPLEIHVNKKDDGIISYQWYQRDSLSNTDPVGGTPIEGEIYPIFYPKTDVPEIAVDYYCVVTNTNLKANGIQTVTTSPSQVLTFITMKKSSLYNAMMPNIVKQPQNEINYDGAGELPTLSIFANVCDNGNLSYQWYKANNEFEIGEKIEGANKNTYNPSVNEIGTKYYYCEVINTNSKAIDNQISKVLSNRSKVTISERDFRTSVRFGNDLSLIFFFKQNKIKGINYYVEINHPNSTNGITKIVIPQTEWKVYTSGGIDYYAVEYNGIAGKQMSDLVSVQVFNNVNIAVTSLYETSIRDYGMGCLSKYTDSTIKTLIVDMLNYGASAQTYFKYNEDDLANKLLTEEQQTYASMQQSYTDHREKEDFYFCGTSARFDNNINLVFFYKNLNSQMKARFTFQPYYVTKEPKVIEVSFAEFKTYNGMYAIELNDLVVADARQIVTCEIMDLNGNVISTVKDSVESYVARSEQGNNIFTNFMKFADSSRIYLKSKNNK